MAANEERNPFKGVGLALVAIGAVFVFARLVMSSNPGPALPRIVNVQLAGVMTAHEGSVMPPSGLGASSKGVLCGPADAALIWLRLPETNLKFLSATIEDETHHRYDYRSNTDFPGALAIIVRRGYDSRPKSLSLTCVFGGEGLAYTSAEVNIPGESLPLPTRVVPATAGLDPSVSAYRSPGGRVHVEVKPTDKRTRAVAVLIGRESFVVDSEAGWTFLKPWKTGVFSQDLFPMNVRFAHELEIEVVEMSTTVETKELEFKSAGLSLATAGRTSSFQNPEVCEGPAGTSVYLAGLRTVTSSAVAANRRRSWLYVDLRVESKPIDLDPHIWPSVAAKILSPSAAELRLSPLDYTVRLVDNRQRMSPAPEVPGETEHTRASAGSLVVRMSVMKPVEVSRRKVVIPIQAADPAHAGRRMGAPAT
jgi:hypothetical protein